MNVEEEFRRRDVLRNGHFQLSSGKHSDTYLQCALALQDPELALDLGEQLAAQLDAEAVDVVASPALGGVLAGFAVAAALERRFVFTERAPGDGGRTMVLRRGQSIAAGERVLIVEDVITTGGSAAEVAALVRGAGATVAGVACLVDRSAGVPADQRLATKPVTLLSTSAVAWDPQACPLCEDGVPLDSPGSRHRS